MITSFIKPKINLVMKKYFLTKAISCPLIVFILLMLSAFSTSDASGMQEVRNPDNFSKISLSMAAKVYVVQGSECRLKIEADENDLEKIETSVKDGKLEIKTKSWASNLKDNVIVRITMPELTGLSVSGSGSVIAESGFDCQELDLSVTGSGSIKMSKLTASTVEALITGSGNIQLDGEKTAGERALTITGSGNYSAEAMEVNHARITITGSGSARINVINELKTNITGSGNVTYRGDPVVNASATGSGRTKKM